MRLAIVGSRLFAEDKVRASHAREFIVWVLEKYQPELVVSGGAKGIDRMGVQEARLHNIPFEEFFPIGYNWEAFKARDMQIAERCTHMVAIIHMNSRTRGADWTAKYAESIGKKVYRKYYSYPAEER